MEDKLPLFMGDTLRLDRARELVMARSIIEAIREQLPRDVNMKVEISLDYDLFQIRRIVKIYNAETPARYVEHRFPVWYEPSTWQLPEDFIAKICLIV
jgi:hypothetical protein